MQELKQWLLSSPAISKRPLNKNGKPAEWLDETTWMTYEDANDAIKAHVATHKGFVFTANDPYLVIDLDNKSNDKDVARYISDVVRMAHDKGHYVEKSVSGLGYHIIFKGVKNCTSYKSGCVEYYDSGRFVIITENGNGNEIIEDQELADKFDAIVGDTKGSDVELTDTPEEFSDQDILDRLFGAKNGDANKQLYYDDVDGDPSQLDQSLIERLCFYSSSNEQVRRLFKASHRGQRMKVIKRGNEYIDRALKFSRSVNEYEKQNINFSIESPHNPLAIKQQELEFPPGLAGMLSNYLFINSVQPIKPFAIANALTTLAGIVGRKYSFRSSTINLFQLIIGRSGVGKDASRKPLFKLRQQLAGDLFGEYFGPEAASGQALFASLEHQPCYSVYTGELADDLLMISGIKASDNARTMCNAYLRLYDEQDFGGKVHRDSKNNVQAVERPAVTIMGSGTPDFFEQLSDHSIKRGLIPRFIILEYDGLTPAFNNTEFAPAHPEILRGLRNLLTYIAHTDDKPVEVRFDCSETEKRSLQMREDIVAKQDIAHSLVEQGLYNRVHLNICRVASVLAATDNPAKPQITMEMLEWAHSYLMYSLNHMLDKFRSGDLGGNTAAQQSGALLQIMRDWYELSDRKRATYCKELMSKNALVPHRYVDARAKMMSCFNTDARGYTRALKETIYTLEMSEHIMTLTAEQKKQHGLRSRIIYAQPLLN